MADTKFSPAGDPEVDILTRDLGGTRGHALAVSAEASPTDGPTKLVIPAITVSTSAYTAGDVLGGKLTLTSAMRVAGGHGALDRLFVMDLDNQKTPLNIFLFSADPTAGTYTDADAFPSLVTNYLDAAKLLTFIQVAASDYVNFGTAAFANKANLNHEVFGATANLFAVIQIASTTPTYTHATRNFQVGFSFLRD